MKVIKNKETYSIALSEKEVDNLTRLVDLNSMLWALIELQDILLKAKEGGECDIRLKDWNYFPPEE